MINNTRCDRSDSTLYPSTHTRLGLGSLAVAALAVLGTLPVSAADVSTDDRLKKIEQQLESLQKENADLKAQLSGPGKSSGTIVRAAGKEQKITLGGMLQSQFEVGNAPDSRFSSNDRFLIRRARLSVAGSFLEDFSWKLEGEFGNGNLRNNGDYRAFGTDVYLNWGHYSFANVRVGQFKTPFGYEQIQSDSVIWFAERSLPSDRFTLGREIGAMVKGDFFTNRLSYSAGIFNGTPFNNGFNDNEKFTYVGRINGTPWKGQIGEWKSQWDVGINGYATKDNSVSVGSFNFDASAAAGIDNLFVGDRRAWGGDTQFKVGRFDLAAEYFRGHFKPKNHVPFTEVDAQGYSVGVAAFVLPKKLQALVRYENFDPNVNVNGDSSDIWVFGLTYFIKDHDLKLQLNYLLGDSAGARDNQGRLLARVQLLF